MLSSRFSDFLTVCEDLGKVEERHGAGAGRRVRQDPREKRLIEIKLYILSELHDKSFAYHIHLVAVEAGNQKDDVLRDVAGVQHRRRHPVPVPGGHQLENIKCN